eukprot:SM000022S07132  [mRNA]  locus=s22:171569:175215:+ [translate_table: standard]
MLGPGMVAAPTDGDGCAATAAVLATPPGSAWLDPRGARGSASRHAAAAVCLSSDERMASQAAHSGREPGDVSLRDERRWLLPASSAERNSVLFLPSEPTNERGGSLPRQQAGSDEAAQDACSRVSSDQWRPPSADRTSSAKRVAVIGGGVSGIAACKVLSEDGHNVTVFEARGSIGGIWSHTYPSTALQTPKEAYRFSDWPWPESVPTFPSHEQVMEYLSTYVRHFNLGARFRLNTRVMKMTRLRVAPGGQAGWSLILEEQKPGSLQPQETVQEFDFAVMCCGCFGDVPKLPCFEPGKGPEVFQGTTLHSAQYSELDKAGTEKLLHGKKVVVVGYQKTSIDVAIEAAEVNRDVAHASCTLLFRKPHWLLPRSQLLYGLPLSYLILSRFAEFWVPKPGQSRLETLKQTLLSPLRSLYFGLIEMYLLYNFPLRKYGLVPEHSFFQDLSACILPQLPDSFFALIEQGSIQLQQSTQWHFTRKGVVLMGEKEIEADVVLLCTGYDGASKLKSVLPCEYRDCLSTPGECLYLYRGMLHPEIPDVAFLGYHEGLSAVQSAEMGSRWLGKVISGTLVLPAGEVMERERQHWRAYKQRQTPFFRRVSCIAPVHIWHYSTLCQDMGWNPRRKPGFLANIFAPHSSMDYCSPAVVADEHVEVSFSSPACKEQALVQEPSARQCLHHWAAEKLLQVCGWWLVLEAVVTGALRGKGSRQAGPPVCGAKED